ncbi:hypothetical protein [Rhodococcoides yunnanense]|uniref:hypothetical protein n=1 Tax=Rhodococcoides yunnanense TaxID=278209 RepID=UPI000B12E1C9|nr:hypothetical protein [Rhodococcus yunnanensis]
MSSSESTAEPFVALRKSHVGLVAGSGVGVVIAAGLVYIALPMLFENRWREAGMALSMALCAVTLAINPWFNQVSSRSGPAVLDRVRDSTVRYERWGLLWLSVIVASFTVFSGFVFVISVPLLLTFYVSLALRSVRNGVVELDADGVRHRGWSFEKAARWETIHSVEIEDREFKNRFNYWRPVVYQCVVLKPQIVLSGHGRNTTRFWRIEKMPTFTIDLDCRRFDVHPVVLQSWIAFYLHNPKMRFELGTESAAERLASISTAV